MLAQEGCKLSRTFSLPRRSLCCTIRQIDFYRKAVDDPDTVFSIPKRPLEEAAGSAIFDTSFR
ncbi:MAG: hypothetical protein OXI54_11905 [Chloroflexota bacterium]|nr:hypothetical protein [Chloroflexota bacterium]